MIESFSVFSAMQEWNSLRYTQYHVVHRLIIIQIIIIIVVQLRSFNHVSWNFVAVAVKIASFNNFLNKLFRFTNLKFHCSIGGFVVVDSEHICDETKRVESPPPPLPWGEYEFAAEGPEVVEEVTEFTTRTIL